ncbi:hypothetical protein QZM22_06275 [Burkholderia oklahomensis]|uniref:hypothetical protein n=1 Tax=Burkholderia oklahomensis TaxID=342113 RepID=UPI002653BD76|nr:hypothetical protein [Burkholderia oklahomensis]MDN7672136.1 hypothetical protein [Burkholderia oklahomensis]
MIDGDFGGAANRASKSLDRIFASSSQPQRVECTDPDPPQCGDQENAEQRRDVSDLRDMERSREHAGEEHLDRSPRRARRDTVLFDFSHAHDERARRGYAESKPIRNEKAAMRQPR